MEGEIVMKRIVWILIAVCLLVSCFAACDAEPVSAELTEPPASASALEQTAKTPEVSANSEPAEASRQEPASAEEAAPASATEVLSG